MSLVREQQSNEVSTSERTATLPSAGDRRSVRWRWLLPALVITVLVLVVLHVPIGVGNMLTPAETLTALAGGEDVPRLHDLAVNLRLPRAILGLLVGAALGVSGALLQALTRNPLASPGILGVSQGAVAAVVAWTAFGPALPLGFIHWVLPLVATAGAFVSVAMVYGFTRRFGEVESTRLLLTGILVGGILSSVTSLCLIFLGEEAQVLLAWLSGSLALKTWMDAGLVALYVLPGFAVALLAIPRANALQLGDNVAVSLGQHRERDRFLVLLPCVLLTSGAVSIVGAIGFVGLIGPHIVRRWVGSDTRRLVPAAALSGSGMVLVADLLARNFHPDWLLAPFGLEASWRAVTLPVGVYLVLFGIPFVLSLLLRKVDE